MQHPQTFISHTQSIVSVLLAMTLLTGCGYKLQGSSSNPFINSSVDMIDMYAFDYIPDSSVTVNLMDNKVSQEFKRHLVNELSSFGIKANVKSHLDNKATHSSTQPNQISIPKITFRQYDLLGVLTEIKIVMMAEVHYSYTIDGKQHTHVQPIQIQRSYQYNKASVSTINQQETQTKKWLYEALAQRISDQYFALNKRN